MEVETNGFWAHTRCDGEGRILEAHPLQDHLQHVCDLAGEFASQFDSTLWASWAGLWHDLGKYRDGFQRYIRENTDAHIEGKVRGREKTHSAAGALWAQQYLSQPDISGKQGAVIARVLAYIIAGHHAGLDNWDSGLKERLNGEDANQELSDALSAQLPEAIRHPDMILPSLESMHIDSHTAIPGSFALWVRMLFSCLVDADFLDTEAFMDAGRSQARGNFADVSVLLERFDSHMATLSKEAIDTPVNRIRADVLSQCRAKAEFQPGVFTLTVPTGGGKTLSSLAFALTHAMRFQKRRVVYAIPYTSIIEQTAGVFREIVGGENVIEHHSNLDSDSRDENTRSRLACENWDAPLIVTTNVQLFESLFARKTSRCRKLHNLANSVIVLDEAQLLPIEFLQPVIDVLRLLVKHYGVTLVFCTATQPVLTSSVSFDPRRGLRGFEGFTEIVSDVPALYRVLKRVRVHRPTDPQHKREWADIAAEIVGYDVVLVIVSRRADAQALYKQLKAHDARGLWHLSALMCPQHRSAVIRQIKDSLAQRRETLVQGSAVGPIRVVSTQLVEAGVDLDFPVVFRAMAGLDSIAQAAGRCNREGRIECGDVHVFVPPQLPPRGLLRRAAQVCETLWSDVVEDPLDLPLFHRYFERLYHDSELDAKGISQMLKANGGAVRFRDASDAFRLIDDKDSATVIVRYPFSASGEIDQWIGMVERDGPARWLMRELQRYGVMLYKHDIQSLFSTGDIREIGGCPGLYVQASDLLYDAVMGVRVDGAPGDPGRLVL